MSTKGYIKWSQKKITEDHDDDLYLNLSQNPSRDVGGLFKRGLWAVYVGKMKQQCVQSTPSRGVLIIIIL